MKIIKRASAILNSFNNDSVTDDLSPEINEHFKKVAAELKVAPKANGFLYFTCIMMHAAEASLFDDKGEIRKRSDGTPVEAKWEKNGKSWKWVSNDKNILPYKNSNRDIFPESELKKAYRNWVGKPLCVDHKSSEADAVRGIIVDTYYDDKRKRLVALCALDKETYPDLAHKVATGVSASVSMGTAVSIAVCTDCGTAAAHEGEFCSHMRAKSCYGEINIGLSPLELSIVVNGADPKAKIRRVIAEANSIAQYVENNLSTNDAKDIKEQLRIKIAELESAAEEISGNNSSSNNEEQIVPTYNKSKELQEGTIGNTDFNIQGFPARLAGILEDLKIKIAQLDGIINQKDLTMTDKRAYFQGGGGVNEPTPNQVKYEKEDSDSIRDKEDRLMTGIQDLGGTDGMVPGDKEKKEMLRRAEVEKRRIQREAALQKAKEIVNQRREAYFQGGGGVNEPTPGKPKYEKEDSDSIRDKEDKQQVGAPPFPGVGKIDGLYGDDLKTKQMLNRAKLRAEFVKASNSDGSDNKAQSRWDVYASEEKENGKKQKRLVLSATVAEIAGRNKVAHLFDAIATRDYGAKIISTIKTQGLDRANKTFKQAQLPEAPAAGTPANAAPPSALPAEMPAEQLADEPIYSGEEGNPVEQVQNNLEEMSNLLAEVQKGVDLLDKEDTSNLDALEPPLAAKAAYSIPRMRKTLHLATKKAMRETVAKIKDNMEELELLKFVFADSNSVTTSNANYISNLASQALADTALIKKEAYGNLMTFSKYARGTNNLAKRFSKTALVTDPILPPENVEDPRRPIPPSFQPGAGHQPSPSNPNLPRKPEEKKPFEEFPEADKLMANDKNIRKMTPEQKEISRQLDEAEKRLLNQYKNMPKDNPFEGIQKDDDGIVVDDIDTIKAKPPVDKTKEKKEIEDLFGIFKQPKEPPFGAPKDVSKADDAVKPTTPEQQRKIDEVKKTVKDNFPAPKPGEIDDIFGNLKKDLNKADDLDSRASRDIARMKVAQKGIQFSKILSEAHPGGGQTTQLDTKPTGDLAKVETLEETHNKMMDLAEASTKVRKDAQAINKFVLAGEIDPSVDFPGLIAQGLDKDAVSYWKKYFGEAKDHESSQFAADAVKEYNKKKAEAENETYRVKLARSYEVANEMVARGMLSGTREAIKEQVDALMQFSDFSFDKFASTVRRFNVKTASIPSIGVHESILGVNEVMLPSAKPTNNDLLENLNAAFRGRKY
jgi:hypothetical protein